jgi:hypothetical protein
MKEDYTMIYETKRKCRNAGSAKTTSSNVICERFGHSGSSPAGRSITILGDTLEGGGDRERIQRENICADDVVAFLRSLSRNIAYHYPQLPL